MAWLGDSFRLSGHLRSETIFCCQEPIGDFIPTRALLLSMLLLLLQMHPETKQPSLLLLLRLTEQQQLKGLLLLPRSSR